MLHHAATRADWDRRTGQHYEPEGYAAEGFVHCSTPEQLVSTLHKHYPGRSDLILLTIDPARLSAPLVYEDLYGSGVEFPHVYGPIEMSAITAVVPLPCDDQGRFDWWRPDDPVVARPVTSATETVHALLDRLAAEGFDGAPRPRWIDGGLEAVSFLEGETAAFPIPSFLRETEPLVSVGRLLRRAHDASRSFAADPPPGARWLAGEVPGGADLVIGHCDVGPGNVVWRGGEAVGLIDWEFAEPIEQGYDLVQASVNLAGHLPEAKLVRGGFDGLDVDARLDALASGYGGLTGTDLRRMVPEVLDKALIRFRERVAAGIDPWPELARLGIDVRLTENLEHARRAAA